MHDTHDSRRDSRHLPRDSRHLPRDSRHLPRDSRYSRRETLRRGALLGVIVLGGCLGGDSLPTATPAGEDDAIDFFFRNAFVENDDSGNKVKAHVAVAVRAVDSEGEISTVYESKFRLAPETTRMVSDTFTPDDAMREYVVNVETVPVLEATSTNREQLRFEPGSSKEPDGGLITVNISNAPDAGPGPDPVYQEVELQT